MNFTQQINVILAKYQDIQRRENEYKEKWSTDLTIFVSERERFRYVQCLTFGVMITLEM